MWVTHESSIIIISRDRSLLYTVRNVSVKFALRMANINLGGYTSGYTILKYS